MPSHIRLWDCDCPEAHVCQLGEMGWWSVGPGADACPLVCEAGLKARVSLRWVGRAQGALGMVSAHWWQSWVPGFLAAGLWMSQL